LSSTNYSRYTINTPWEASEYGFNLSCSSCNEKKNWGIAISTFALIIVLYALLCYLIKDKYISISKGKTRNTCSLALVPVEKRDVAAKPLQKINNASLIIFRIGVDFAQLVSQHI